MARKKKKKTVKDFADLLTPGFQQLLKDTFEQEAAKPDSPWELVEWDKWSEVHEVTGGEEER